MNTSRPRILVALLALSAAGFVGITQREAFRAAAYNDGVGVSTIGFGTTEGVKPGDTITAERALVRSLTDMAKYEGAIKRCVKVPLHQYEYDSYVSVAYNIGPAAFCGSTMVKRLNAGDYAGACVAIEQWNKAGGKVSRGLVNRRAQERAQCEGRT